MNHGPHAQGGPHNANRWIEEGLGAVDHEARRDDVDELVASRNFLVFNFIEDGVDVGFRDFLVRGPRSRDFVFIVDFQAKGRQGNRDFSDANTDIRVSIFDFGILLKALRKRGSILDGAVFDEALDAFFGGVYDKGLLAKAMPDEDLDAFLGNFETGAEFVFHNRVYFNIPIVIFLEV